MRNDSSSRMTVAHPRSLPMMHPMIVQHPPLPWTLDASLSRVTPDALDALPWDHVYDEMEALEAGAAQPDTINPTAQLQPEPAAIGRLVEPQSDQDPPTVSRPASGDGGQ